MSHNFDHSYIRTVSPRMLRIEDILIKYQHTILVPFLFFISQTFYRLERLSYVLYLDVSNRIDQNNLEY